jgi:Flp pilus assembly protein TadG
VASSPRARAGRTSRTGRTTRTERGAATAELAMVLPLLVAVAIALVWLLSVGTAQVRAVDAARETARALARGDDEAEALDRGRTVAPDGSTIAVTHADGEVHVTVTGRVRGPGGLLAHVPSPRLRAEAVAAEEQSGLPLPFTTADAP